jgi:hypothetical protein
VYGDLAGGAYFLGDPPACPLNSTIYAEKAAELYSVLSSSVPDPSSTSFSDYSTPSPSDIPSSSPSSFSYYSITFSSDPPSSLIPPSSPNPSSFSYYSISFSSDPLSTTSLPTEVPGQPVETASSLLPEPISV